MGRRAENLGGNKFETDLLHLYSIIYMNVALNGISTFLKKSTICFLIHVMMKTKRDIPQLCILYIQKETRFFVYHIFVFNAKILLCLSSLAFYFHIQNSCARGEDFYRTFISPNNDASNG